MRIKTSKATLSWVALSLALGSAGGCILELYGETPVDQAFYFPISMAASQDGSHVYVLSSNYDQRYNTGWVSVLDVDAVLAQEDALSATIAPLVPKEDGGQVSVLNLGGMIALDPTGEHLLVSHRGKNHLDETRLSWIDVTADGASISCGDADFTGDMTAQEGKTDCDEDHIIRIGADGSDDSLVDYEADGNFGERTFENAFSLVSFDFITEDGTTKPMMAVGFVNSEYVRLYEIVDGNPVITKTLKTTISGAGQMVYHRSGDSQYLLVGGRSISTNAVAAVDLTKSLAEDDTVSYEEGLEGLAAASVLGLDTSPDGQRVYVGSGHPQPNAGGMPDVLAVLDGASVVTNEHSEGLDTGVPVIRPSLDLLFIEPLMGRPSDVKYMVRGPTADGTERDDLILVSSFDGDALHVFTPTRQGARLAARVELASKSSNGEGVGRGPFAVEVVERQGRSLVFVTNFFEHSVTVFDFSAVHPSDFSQVAKVQNETIEISDSSF